MSDEDETCPTCHQVVQRECAAHLQVFKKGGTGSEYVCNLRRGHVGYHSARHAETKEEVARWR
jgi:hypothetical protein